MDGWLWYHGGGTKYDGMRLIGVDSGDMPLRSMMQGGTRGVAYIRWIGEVPIRVVRSGIAWLELDGHKMDWSYQGWQAGMVLSGVNG
jgi:hypothetical protein